MRDEHNGGGRQWQVRAGGLEWELWANWGMSARARPLLPECALVNKIYCEDARVSCSCLGKQRGRERGWGHVASSMPQQQQQQQIPFGQAASPAKTGKEGNWVCFSISRAATWPQTWQATQLTKLLLYGLEWGSRLEGVPASWCGGRTQEKLLRSQRQRLQLCVCV